MSDTANQANPIALVPAPAPRLPVPVGVRVGTLDEAFRLSQAIARSEFGPKCYRTPENALVAILSGAECGLSPMTAIQGGMVVNGRWEPYGDTLLAIAQASPDYDDFEEWYEVGGARREALLPEDLKSDTTTAVCEFRRRGKVEPIRRWFSIAQAKKAGLWTKAGPWQEYPDRMLRMRARSWAARDALPGAFNGLPSLGDPRDLPSVEDMTSEPPKLVHRLSERRADEPAAASPTADPPANATPATLGPLTVLRVEHLLGGACAMLADGVQLWIPDDADAKELGKFAGTDHALLFTADHNGPWPVAADSWRLVSFEIAH